MRGCLHCLAVACSLCGINTCTVWHFAQYVTGLHRPAWRPALSCTYAESLPALFTMLALAAAWKPTLDSMRALYGWLMHVPSITLFSAELLSTRCSIPTLSILMTLALCSMEATHCIPTLTILMIALLSTIAPGSTYGCLHFGSIFCSYPYGCPAM